MKVMDAVAEAKRHLMLIYATEDIRNLGLEEVELNENDNEWCVTLGFSRPWDEPRNALASLAAAAPRRVYKIVKVSNETGQVRAIKAHEVKS